MSSLRLSNIDEYISGKVRTDAIEIVVGEQKRFICNSGINLTNYSFTTKIEYFNATVTNIDSDVVTITSFSKINQQFDSDRTDIVVVTNAVAGNVEFRIPRTLVRKEVEVPIDSATPLIVAVTITVNRDTTASFPIIDKETVLIINRYAAR
jgi:hypothetical protein